MFGIQFRLAFINLMYPPTVDSTSEKGIEDVDLPLITICPTNQTNAKMLEKWFDEKDGVLTGFCGQFSVLEVLEIVFEEQFAAKTNKTFDGWILGLNNETGKDLYLSNRHLAKRKCWDRPWLNLTYMDILESVHNKNLAKGIGFAQQVDFPNVSSSLVFLPSYGFCREVTHFDPSGELTCTAAGQLRVFITDRNFRSHISPYFSSHRGNHIFVTDRKLNRYDVRTQVSSSCGLKKDNVKKNFYQICVEERIQNEIGKPLGCVPPWISPNNHCNGTYKDNFLSSIPGIKDFHQDFIRSAITLRNNPIENDCRKYCSEAECTVSYRIDETWPYSKTTEVSLTFNPKVKYLEIVYSYNMFQFIIDVGSSLGLWLGVSVLSITDFASYVYAFIKEKYIFKSAK